MCVSLVERCLFSTLSVRSRVVEEQEYCSRPIIFFDFRDTEVTGFAKIPLGKVELKNLILVSSRPYAPYDCERFSRSEELDWYYILLFPLVLR